MKFSIAILVALAFICPIPLLHADDASDRAAAAEEMIKAMHADEMITKTLAAQRAAFTKMAPSFLPKDAPAETVQKLQEMMPKILDTVYKQLTWESLKPDFIQIYSETFTVEEMKGLTDFYKSPLGQKLIAKMPELSGKSMQIMQKRIEPMMAEMQKTIKAMDEETPGAENPPAPATTPK